MIGILLSRVAFGATNRVWRIKANQMRGETSGPVEQSPNIAENSQDFVRNVVSTSSSAGV